MGNTNKKNETKEEYRRYWREEERARGSVGNTWNMYLVGNRIKYIMRHAEYS